MVVFSERWQKSEGFAPKLQSFNICFDTRYRSGNLHGDKIDKNKHHPVFSQWKRPGLKWNSIEFSPLNTAREKASSKWFFAGFLVVSHELADPTFGWLTTTCAWCQLLLYPRAAYNTLCHEKTKLKYQVVMSPLEATDHHVVGTFPHSITWSIRTRKKGVEDWGFERADDVQKFQHDFVWKPNYALLGIISGDIAMMRYFKHSTAVLQVPNHAVFYAFGLDLILHSQISIKLRLCYRDSVSFFAGWLQVSKRPPSAERVLGS